MKVAYKKAKTPLALLERQLHLPSLPIFLVLAILAGGSLQYASGQYLDSSSDLWAPTFSDIRGERILEAAAGQQIMIHKPVGNDFHLDEGDLLTLIVEVRDPDGVTVFVAWQTAKFSQDNVYNFGASWTVPKDASAGKAYEARAFILTFIEGEAMPLSAVLASKITVV